MNNDLAINVKHVLTMVLTLFLLVGCSTEGDDLDQYIRKVKATKVKPASTLPPAAVIARIDYRPKKPLDPFKAFYYQPPVVESRVKTECSRVEPDADKVSEDLEGFELSSLKMLGSLEKKGLIWGLVVDPQGLVHRVEVGNYLGKNQGRIIGITPNSIQVDEIIADPAPECAWLVRSTTLTIIE